jgi:hypothetical protein
MAGFTLITDIVMLLRCVFRIRLLAISRILDGTSQLCRLDRPALCVEIIEVRLDGVTDQLPVFLGH